jgi:hypothetical protein
MTTDAAVKKREIRPRSFPMSAGAEVPRHWMAGNIVATALGNGVNMLFPAGERFFVRSVRRFLPQVPAELRERAQGFFGQEGRHAQAHERINELLTQQGFEVAGFLRLYERFCYGFVEKLAPEEVRLAATAACEHFTAIMADNFLRQPEFTESLHPLMRKLLCWHAAEEIEHKSVAFDVLQEVNDSYRLRMVGLALAAFFLGTMWGVGTLVLLADERKQVGLGAIWRDAKRLAKLRRERQRRGILTEVFYRGIREYMQRDFHPDHNDNYDLAREFLQAAGMA